MKRILIVRLSSLGDVVLSTAVPEALRRAWPGAEIAVATRMAYAPVFEGHPAVDRVFAFGPAGLRSLVAEVRAWRPDAVLDLHGTFRSRLICLASGARRVARVRKAAWRRRWLLVTREKTARDRDESVTARYLEAAGRLTVAGEAARTGDSAHGEPVWRVSPEESAAAEAWLRAAGWKGEPLVALVPGATWETKRWPSDSWADTARRLAESGARPVVFGGENDRSLADAILARGPANLLDAVGRTDLRLLGAMLSRCQACVTTDSGPMHIAGAVGVPVAALFGPTVRAFGFTPRGPNDVVLERDLPCRPCSLHGSHACPIGTHACMKEISPDDVLCAVGRAVAPAAGEALGVVGPVSGVGYRARAPEARSAADSPWVELVRRGPVRPHPEPVPARVLVIQTAFFGDTILTVPLLNAIKRTWRGAWLAVVASPRGAEFLEACSPADEVIVYDKRGRDRSIRGFLALSRRLLGTGYDLAILPHRSFRSGLLARLAGVPLRVGFARGGARWWCTRRVPRRLDRHDLERLADLGAAAGVNVTPEDLRVEVSAASRQRADALFGEFGAAEGGAPIVGLAPGSEWATKRWPAARFAVLAAALAGKGMHVALFGGAQDAALAREVERLAGVPVANLAGRIPQGDLAAAFSRLAAFVTNDSGPMHLATLLQVPVVAIFGPTVPAFGYAPYPVGGISHAVLGLDLPCQPCTPHGGARCPIGTHECMTGISVEMVADGVRRAVAGTSDGGGKALRATRNDRHHP